MRPSRDLENPPCPIAGPPIAVSLDRDDGADTGPVARAAAGAASAPDAAAVFKNVRRSTANVTPQASRFQRRSGNFS
jgi:hypothetical protein